MNPEELSISETLQYLREQWVNRFSKEGYDEVAKTLEDWEENRLTELKEEPTINFLKKHKAPNNHCKVYIEAMQGDFEAKLFGEHRQGNQTRLE